MALAACGGFDLWCFSDARFERRGVRRRPRGGLRLAPLRRRVPRVLWGRGWRAWRRRARPRAPLFVSVGSLIDDGPESPDPCAPSSSSSEEAGVGLPDWEAAAEAVRRGRGSRRESVQAGLWWIRGLAAAGRRLVPPRRARRPHDGGEPGGGRATGARCRRPRPLLGVAVRGGEAASVPASWATRCGATGRARARRAAPGAGRMRGRGRPPRSCADAPQAAGCARRAAREGGASTTFREEGADTCLVVGLTCPPHLDHHLSFVCRIHGACDVSARQPIQQLVCHRMTNKTEHPFVTYIGPCATPERQRGARR